MVDLKEVAWDQKYKGQQEISNSNSYVSYLKSKKKALRTFTDFFQ
jgi:hypothetical protein